MSINENYKLYLKHNSSNFWETVLFALPSNEKTSLDLDLLEDDVNRTQLLWKTYINIYHSKEKSIKRTLLVGYVAATKILCGDIQNFSVSYDYDNLLPVFRVFKNDNIYYSIRFNGNFVFLMISFDDKMKDKHTIISKCKDLQQLCKDLLLFESEKSYHYLIQMQVTHNIKTVSTSMANLILSTYPIIVSNILDLNN